MASTITMTDTDPGEGSALSNDNFVAVYGGTSLLDVFYPIGSYYETSNTSFNPNVSWGGVWELDSQGRVTVSQNSSTFSTVGDTGGEETHSLTQAELPNLKGSIDMHGSGASGTTMASSTGILTSKGTLSQWRDAPLNSGASSIKGVNINIGQNQPHNNLQPYVVVKRWHRTA